MGTDLLRDPLWLLVLGGGLLFFSGYFLQLSANLCGADPPSFKKSVLTAMLTLAAAFLAYDLTGYGIFLATRDELDLILPAGFSYLDWLKEPIYLKWQVLGLVPGIRYLPVLFAVLLASILYVLVLKVPYRVSMVVFLLQWTLSLVSLAVLSFALTLTQGFLGQTAIPTAEDLSNPQARATPPGATPAERAATRPGPRRQPAQPGTPLSTGSPLKQTLAEYQEKAGPTLAWLKQEADSIHQQLDPYLGPIREATHSYTIHLPLVVQEFLDDGGWWLVVLALAVTGWFWVRGLYRRLNRALFGKRRRKKTARKSPAQGIELRYVGEALTELGPVQALVRDRAVRLRLVIMAPAVSYIGDLLPEMAEGLLDYVKPGLGDVVEYDTPRIVVWPRQGNEALFQQLFFKQVQVPEERGRRSRWILLAGTIRLGRQKVHVGLAVHADLASNLREVRVEKEDWGPVLGLRQMKELV